MKKFFTRSISTSMINDYIINQLKNFFLNIIDLDLSSSLCHWNFRHFSSKSMMRGLFLKNHSYKTNLNFNDEWLYYKSTKELFSWILFILIYLYHHMIENFNISLRNQWWEETFLKIISTRSISTSMIDDSIINKLKTFFFEYNWSKLIFIVMSLKISTFFFEINDERKIS